MKCKNMDWGSLILMSPEVSACSVHVCVIFCGIMLYSNCLFILVLPCRWYWTMPIALNCEGVRSRVSHPPGLQRRDTRAFSTRAWTPKLYNGSVSLGINFLIYCFTTDQTMVQLVFVCISLSALMYLIYISVVIVTRPGPTVTDENIFITVCLLVYVRLDKKVHLLIFPVSSLIVPWC